LDAIPELCIFADKLEKACIKTVEEGKLTKSLALISTFENPVILNSLDFIKAIRETLNTLL
jgi:isocitrate dehydrogenase